MNKFYRSIIIALGVFGMTISMSLGITIQKWAKILTPLAYSDRVLLLVSAGLIIFVLSVWSGIKTLLSFRSEKNLLSLVSLQLVAVFSLEGFGFGLLMAALTLAIFVY